MSIVDELKLIKEPCRNCLHLFHGSIGFFCKEELPLGSGYCCKFTPKWLEPKISTKIGEFSCLIVIYSIVMFVKH